MWILGTMIDITSPKINIKITVMSDTEKLDLILQRLEENNKILIQLLGLAENDTPTKDFLLNIGANVLGNLIYPGNTGKEGNYGF